MNTSQHGQSSPGGSNYRWHADSTELDILVQATTVHGSPPVRPQLAVVVDEASECVMGLHLGFAGSDRTLALALGHAVLPKRYPVEYGLHHEWQTYGVPEYLLVDRSLTNSQPLKQLATRLTITVQTQSEPSQLSSFERFFQSMNREYLAHFPEYTGSSGGSYAAQATALVSVVELERALVQYIVDHYSQHLHPRVLSQTRFQKWQSGLVFAPPRLQPQDLDL